MITIASRANRYPGETQEDDTENELALSRFRFQGIPQKLGTIGELAARRTKSRFS